MSLRTGMHRLQDATKAFEVRWSSARDQWADRRAREFEAERIQPVQPAARSAIAAMEQMAEMTSRARQECS
ncbi:MAG: hypothetical protein ACIAQF_08595 [Phycisphaerales bacterium JB065]